MRFYNPGADATCHKSRQVPQKHFEKFENVSIFSVAFEASSLFERIYLNFRDMSRQSVARNI